MRSARSQDFTLRYRCRPQVLGCYFESYVLQVTGNEPRTMHQIEKRQFGEGVRMGSSLLSESTEPHAIGWLGVPSAAIRFLASCSSGTHMQSRTNKVHNDVTGMLETKLEL
eukprot:4816069-Amphidinium_carterae.1